MQGRFIPSQFTVLIVLFHGTLPRNLKALDITFSGLDQLSYLLLSHSQ